MPRRYGPGVQTTLVLSGKGGSGKTTVARELAVAGCLDGRRVVLVDLDPQAGLTGWFSRRKAPQPILVTLPPGYELDALIQAGTEELVIDVLRAYLVT